MTRNFDIAGRTIGINFPPYIIGEMSANHNGRIENAFKILKMAKSCGADAVKIQSYTPDTITLKANSDDFKIKSGLWKGKTLYELYQWAHTPWEWHKDLFDFAREIGITLFSTPFDGTAVELLEKLNAPAYKIASFECTDLELIKQVARTNKPIVISTGMANEHEIMEAVETAERFGNGDIAILHCVSGYPASAKDYNLNTLPDMQNRFNVNVGLSDHTIENTTAIASIALGAVLIEKHITLNRQGGGPDDSFSLEEDGFRELCSSTKIAWEALGRINYERKASEIDNVKFRRSLYFVRSLEPGEVIQRDDIRSVRPGYGLPPKYLQDLIGSTVLKAVKMNSPVKIGDVFLRNSIKK